MEMVLRRDELRPEPLSSKVKRVLRDICVLLSPSCCCCWYPTNTHTSVPPKHSRSWPSSSAGSMSLRTRLPSNFPKGLRLISSHTGAEREREEWEQGWVASGEELPGAPHHPTGRQSGGLDSLGALKVSGQAG